MNALTPKQPRKPGRPHLPKGAARVVLPAQRISPAAMAILDTARIHMYGGIGKILDAALLGLPKGERAIIERCTDERYVVKLKE